jgi:hypothetical protein
LLPATAGSKDLSGGSQDFTAGSQCLSGGSQDFTAGSQCLSGGSQDFTAGSQCLSAGSQEFTAGSQCLSGGSQDFTAEDRKWNEQGGGRRSRDPHRLSDLHGKHPVHTRRRRRHGGAVTAEPPRRVLRVPLRCISRKAAHIRLKADVCMLHDAAAAACPQPRRRQQES